MENKTVVATIVETYLEKEHKTKLKDLFKFFCNHVFLGQWELAKSAIPRLVEELKQSDVNIDFLEMLMGIAEFPFSQRYDDGDNEMDCLLLTEVHTLTR